MYGVQVHQAHLHFLHLHVGLQRVKHAIRLSQKTHLAVHSPSRPLFSFDDPFA